MTGTFARITILYCEDRNYGFRGEFLVGQFVPGNCSGIGSGSGCVLGCFNGLQDQEFRQGYFGLNSVGGRCFGEKGSRSHGVFKVIVDGVDGVFVIEK